MSNKIIHLPLPNDIPRMESTVIQFGDDWPGCFLRGDASLHLAHMLEHAAKNESDAIYTNYFKGYAEFFASCDARKATNTDQSNEE